jgi:hypothetical protein
MIGRRFCHRAEQFAGLLLLATLCAATARADGLMGHSVSYDVKAAPAEKAHVEAQASFTLSRSCEGWSLGEVFQFGIEKGEAAAANKKLSDKAERFEERVSAQEPISGRALAYQTRTRQNARVTTTTGTATLGSDTPGTLSATIGRYVQESVLPPRTLAPAAARAALLEALTANRPGAIEIRTVDILRFHKPILQSFLRLAPEDGSIAHGLPKDMRASTREFASGRLWALRRQVPEFNEFGDELWLIHESGAIVRQTVQRQGIKLLLEAREVSTFPAPRCP